jgi:small neutral amino acid transporter SnatA (MarC family)
MKLKLFDRFAQLVPVLIPFMACVGVVAELVPAYGELDTRFALVLSVILAVYMLLMFWHTSTSELLQTSYLTGATRTIQRILLLIGLSLIGIGFAYLLFLVRPR